jgi:hypothetical protein
MAENRTDIAIEIAEAIAKLLDENAANRPTMTTAEEWYGWAVTVVRIFASSLRSRQAPRRGRPRNPKAEA